ncbi:hypothetical protein [Paenibacillus elgii]|nr:hypothetical protein [Paenibacillus elgii]NEN86085.1 hypothetical protein [Paenibacillus elgii]
METTLSAASYVRRIKHHPELTIFHGRSELNRQGIRKMYDRMTESGK